MSDVLDEQRRESANQVSAEYICKICQRARLRNRWGIGCFPCRRVDAAVGRLHTAASLTPSGGLADIEGETLAERLGHVPEDLEDRVRAFHTERLLAMSALMRASTGRPGVAKWPGGPPWALVADWHRWSATFPAWWEVSVECFQVYVRTLHPWALDVEPRINDGVWLRDLVRVE